jgi:hypothetical protein
MIAAAMPAITNVSKSISGLLCARDFSSVFRLAISIFDTLLISLGFWQLIPLALARMCWRNPDPLGHLPAALLTQMTREISRGPCIPRSSPRAANLVIRVEIVIEGD